MEDLDLDELDQAVTKMMDKSSRGKRGVQKESVTVPARPAPAQVAKSDQASVTVSSTPDPEKASEESPAAPAPRSEPARIAVNRPMPRVPERRRMHPGAMDIIQPSAPAKVAAPSSRPGRTAASLQPTQDVTPEPVRSVVPEKAESAPEPVPTPTRALDTPQDVSDEVLASLSLLDEPKPAQNLLTPDMPAATSVEPKKTDGWPDPLDFHDFGDTHHEELKTESPEPKETTDVMPDPLTVTQPDAPAQVSEEPKETPPSIATEPVSVTDSHEDAAFASSSPFVTTKVEKRPLGAFADASPEPAKPDTSEPAPAPVPHESTSKEEMASASLESKQHLDQFEHDDHESADLRAMSIPQHYHTSDHKPKDDMRPVFDTKEYHAAPPHMYAPRKGGPGLVIGVVVLIVLIIAAVLVGYFMMTGTFDLTKLW